MSSLLFCCLLTSRAYFQGFEFGFGEVCFIFILLFVLCFCKPHIACERVINGKAYQCNFCVLQIVYLNAVLLYLGQCLRLGSPGGEPEMGIQVPLGQRVWGSWKRQGKELSESSVSVGKQLQPDPPQKLWSMSCRIELVLPWDQRDGLLWPRVSQFWWGGNGSSKGISLEKGEKLWAVGSQYS